MGDSKDIFPRNFLEHVARCQEITDNPEAFELGFLPREFIQTTLPYRQPKGNPPGWFRKNGHFTLYIQPGLDPKTQTQLPYPTGNIPRLLLCWLATEVMRTDSPRIEFVHTFAEFMRMLGLNPRSGGKKGTVGRLKQQMRSLFKATIGFDYTDDNYESWHDMKIAPEGQIWWSDLYPNQPNLFDNWIELSPQFFQAIRKQAIPLDMRIITAPKIKERPMAIDLYAWATMRAFVAYKNNKDLKIPWVAFKEQLGTDYERLRAFRTQAMQNFQIIQMVYDGLKLDFPDKDYFVIKKTSRPSVIEPSEAGNRLK